MARAATAQLGEKLERGIVVTKYGHAKGRLDRVQCYEGGHPVPDENSFRGTEAILEMTAELTQEDTVLFLLCAVQRCLSSSGTSGRTSGYYRPASCQQRRYCGNEHDSKTPSGVKGGKFALHCAARIFSVVLSDIIGDPLDMIASGPACPDSSLSPRRWPLQINIICG